MLSTLSRVGFVAIAMALIVRATAVAVEDAEPGPVRPVVQFVQSDSGEHAWLIRGQRAWVGAHNDRLGTWVDLRSGATRTYPEIAIVVPEDGGHARLQVCETGGEPITVDLVKAAKLLNRLLREEE